MLVAELEIRHSRPVAPTRRVALGRAWLPTDPPPGFGGILLAAVVAANVGALDDEMFEELDRLLDDLERGRRPAQPRLRHRLQTDVVGLVRSRHRLEKVGNSLALDLDDDHAHPLPQILGAVYTAAALPEPVRGPVFRLLRRATRWSGGLEGLLEFLTGDATGGFRRRGFPTDERWALEVLGFGADSEPGRGEIQHRFRQLVREAHPDNGGTSEGAGQRILELTEAKRILVGRTEPVPG